MLEGTISLAPDIIQSAFPVEEFRSRMSRYTELTNTLLAEMIQYDDAGVGNVADVKRHILSVLSPSDVRRWHIVVCRYSMNTGQFIVRIGRYKLK